MQSDCDVARQPYQRVALNLMAHATAAWPELPPEAIALGAPPWFVERLAHEAGQPLASRPPIVRLSGSPVVGLADLDRASFGRFVVQDLIYGDAYDLPYHCHADIHPSYWKGLTLALWHSLEPQLALVVASLRP